jgi:hypothetical protein
VRVTTTSSRPGAVIRGSGSGCVTSSPLEQVPRLERAEQRIAVDEAAARC